MVVDLEVDVNVKVSPKGPAVFNLVVQLAQPVNLYNEWILIRDDTDKLT